VSGDSILLEVSQDEKQEAEVFIHDRLHEFNGYDFSGSNKKQYKPYFEKVLNVLLKIKDNQKAMIKSCKGLYKDTPELNQFNEESFYFKEVVSYQYFSLETINKWIFERVQFVKNESIKNLMLNIQVYLTQSMNDVHVFAEKTFPDLDEIQKNYNQYYKLKESKFIKLKNIVNNIVFVDNTNKAIQSIKKIISKCSSLSQKTKQCLKGICSL